MNREEKPNSTPPCKTRVDDFDRWFWFERCAYRVI